MNSYLLLIALSVIIGSLKISTLAKNAWYINCPLATMTLFGKLASRITELILLCMFGNGDQFFPCSMSLFLDLRIGATDTTNEHPSATLSRAESPAHSEP